MLPHLLDAARAHLEEESGGVPSVRQVPGYRCVSRVDLASRWPRMVSNRFPHALCCMTSVREQVTSSLKQLFLCLEHIVMPDVTVPAECEHHGQRTGTG